ncbi:citrate synthase family protein [Endothiovibrio diazotrophicus]
MKDKVDTLRQYEGRWRTDMGKWFPGERVVLRGRDLLHDLRDMRWMELLLFGITGRHFSAEQIRLFEGIWSLSVSYPDPRIWPNRIAALAATARSTATLGVSSALAISEGELFGHRSNIRTIDFLIRARQEVDAGTDLDRLVRGELKRHRWIPGFGRPIVRTDERIGPLMEFARDLGFGDGPHTALAFRIEEILKQRRYPMRMNIGALDAALAADQGLSSEEYHRYFMLSFSAGMVPCFIDADRKPEGAFFPLRCASLVYEGESAERRWGEEEG